MVWRVFQLRIVLECLYWNRVAQIPDRDWFINELYVAAGGLLEVSVAPSCLSQHQIRYTSNKLVICLCCSHAGQYNSEPEVKECF